MSRKYERHETCFNCGSHGHKLVLVYSSGGTFWRCTDQMGCKRRLGGCAKCGRLPDMHGFQDHGFQRNAAAQAAVDEAYPV